MLNYPPMLKHIFKDKLFWFIVGFVILTVFPAVFAKKKPVPLPPASIILPTPSPIITSPLSDPAIYQQEEIPTSADIQSTNLVPNTEESTPVAFDSNINENITGDDSYSTTYQNHTNQSWELKYNGMNNTSTYAPQNAELKYNGFSDTYQYANPDDTLKYNGYNNTYQYAPDSAELKYNGMNDTYQYANKNDVLKYNGFDNTYQYAPEDSSLRYNGMNNTYQYVPND